MSNRSKILAVLLLSSSVCGAEVRLPAIISDHMILQRGKDTPVWGWAKPGEKVKVKLDEITAKTTADENGRWRVELDLTAAGSGPYTLRVKGENTLKVEDVLVGEVWLASGQSNMKLLLRRTNDAREEATVAANPQLREFTVEDAWAEQPLEDVKGRWNIATPQSTPYFSATAYFFAKMLQRELQVPVGIVNSTVGGTMIESWLSDEALNRDEELRAYKEPLVRETAEYPGKREKFQASLRAWLEATGRNDPGSPHPEVYTGDTISPQEWTPITIPGEIKGAGLPEAGVIWLRKVVNIPADKAGKALQVEISQARNVIEKLYWNGREVSGYDVASFPGEGSERDHPIFGENVREGENVLALRLYIPVRGGALEKFPGVEAGTAQNGEWLARAEVAFPPLPADAPKAPAMLKDKPGHPHTPSQNFNAMVHPLLGSGLRGILWYQGESNVSNPERYRRSFPLLIADWRQQAGRELPFYFCQLPRHREKTDEPQESQLAELREAQEGALKLPETGEAVLIDSGEARDIHPRDKRVVGERLARLALQKTYGRDVVSQGPTFRELRIEGNRAIVRFDTADGELQASPLPAEYLLSSEPPLKAPLTRHSPKGSLEGFAICGDDRKWEWAEAEIQGDTVIVSSPQVPHPVAVRYGWGDNPTCNLVNSAGLPAPPFRTDNFPPNAP